MNDSFDHLVKGLTPSTWRRRLKKFTCGLAGLALIYIEATIAWADRRPPESSVTPPSVVTLDPFAERGENVAGPNAALVEQNG